MTRKEYLNELRQYPFANNKYWPNLSTMKKIFVFGSNIDGIHGAGAAQAALQHHGAIRGVGFGIQGNSYTIATKDLNKGERSVPLSFIARQIMTMYDFARMKPDHIFMVTRIGCGHAGFTEQEIGPLFDYNHNYQNPTIEGLWNTVRPDNVLLCPEFQKYQTIKEQILEFDPSPLI